MAGRVAAEVAFTTVAAPPVDVRRKLTRIDRTGDITTDESMRGPLEDCSCYRCGPTFPMPGLTALHIEFVPVAPASDN